MIKRTITITLTGNTESDVEDAFEEAVTQLKAGNVCGFDKNETSSFSFENNPTADVNPEVEPVATVCDDTATDAMVRRIAALSIWGFDNDDGEPYDECEEPDDGYNDSHTCLMGLIEEARELLDLGDKGPDSDASLLFSLDGGQSYLPAPSGVRMIYRNIEIDGESGLGELHLNATHEGLITDIWTSREEHLDHNIATDSQLVSEIVTRLVNLSE